MGWRWKRTAPPKKKNAGLPPNDTLTAPVNDVPSPLPSVPPHTSEPEGDYQATPPVLPPPTTPSLTPPGAARANGGAKPAIPPLPPRTTAPAAGAPLPVSTKLRSTVGIGAKPQAVETESVVVTGERPSQPFTFEELLATWRAFSALRKQQTDMASEQVILNRDLTLTGTTVGIKLDNHVQADLFTSMLPDLLIYLRQNLQNWQLQVEHVVEMVETKKMIYTPQDKYNYLAEKNPALHKLRQALGLEVDY